MKVQNENQEVEPTQAARAQSIPCSHTVSRALLRASQGIQKESAFSSSLPDGHERIGAMGAVPTTTDGNNAEPGDSTSGSWFRRLWNHDDDAVSVVPAPEVEFSAHSGPATQQAEHETGPQTQQQSVRHEIAMPDHATAFPEADTANGEHSPASAQPPAQTAGIPPPHSASGQNPAESAVQTTAQEPAPPAARPRPPRPLSYRQLAAAAGLPINGGSQQRHSGSAPAPRESDSGPRHAVSGPSGASNSSASRRAANPFDRPSLYRPPALSPSSTTDQSFEDAFTTDPGRPSSSSGRWDPIPPLRPSGWRDSGSFRAAGNTPNPDDPWNWKPSPSQNSDQNSGQSAARDSREYIPDGAAAPELPAAEDSEPTLTRQWGLLSRFQQARGLGLPARRSTDDSSGGHEVATPGTGSAKDNQKP